MKSASESGNIEALREFAKECGVMMTEEQMNDVAQKLTECKTEEELISYIGLAGFELSDEQLDAVSGGGCYPDCTADNWVPL